MRELCKWSSVIIYFLDLSTVGRCLSLLIYNFNVNNHCLQVLDFVFFLVCDNFLTLINKALLKILFYITSIWGFPHRFRWCLFFPYLLFCMVWFLF